MNFEVASLPPSVNIIYKRTQRGGLYLNPKVLEFKKLVAEELGKIEYNMFTDKLKVEIIYHVTRSNIDLDNLNKITLDSMNKLVYVDDKQIYELNVQKIVGKEKKTVINIMLS